MGYRERRQDKTSGGASTHLRVRYRLCPSDRCRASRHSTFENRVGGLKEGICGAKVQVRFLSWIPRVKALSDKLVREPPRGESILHFASHQIKAGGQEQGPPQNGHPDVELSGLSTQEDAGKLHGTPKSSSPSKLATGRTVQRRAECSKKLKK